MQGWHVIHSRLKKKNRKESYLPTVKECNRNDLEIRRKDEREWKSGKLTEKYVPLLWSLESSINW